MLKDGATVAGYRIERLLGRGGMGAVFRARHVDSGRVVALKLLDEPTGTDPGLGARLRREGRAQASFDHPHVVTIYDAGDSEHGVYLAMRLVDGPRLADELRERRLGARRALALLEQVADALDAAHAAGLVHRDVKPQNVLVGADDHAYLADFGLARGGDATAGTAGTATDGLAGTVAYLSPEVVRGEEATAASDRYAFAAMAFECLTGTVVFPRPTAAGVLFAHAGDPPPAVSARRPELGAQLDAVFARALAKNPSARPASAHALVAEIRAELERSGAIALPAPPPLGAGALGAARTGGTAVHGGSGADTDAATVVPPSLPAAVASSGSAPPPPAAPSTAVPSSLTPSPAARPGGGRRRWLPVVLAALAGAAVVAVAWAAIGSGDDAAPLPAPAASLLAERPGLRYIGADLDGAPGRPLTCTAAAVTSASPPCTLVQSQLPGATLVVPANGVIRHWAVRGAEGELTLVVLRPRDGGAFQVTVSRAEFAGDADVESFDADLSVDRGDLVGVLVAPGAAVGARPRSAGARIDRWLPPLTGIGRPPDGAPGAAFDSELLLRVGLLPGGRPRAARELTGSAAAALPAGRVLERRDVRVGGRAVELALVRVGDRFALDARAGGAGAAGRRGGDARAGGAGAAGRRAGLPGEGGRRIARIAVPELLPGAQLVRFVAAEWGPDAAGLDLHFVNAGSARVVQLGYVFDTQRLTRIR